MRLGLLIPEFPGLTHILFWREIRRMRELGAEVRVVSTRAPADRSPHDFAGEPCTYLWPPAGAVPPRPDVLARQLRFALSLPQGGWRERARVLAMLPSAWTLAAWLRRERIDHLHVHSFANALYLAALAHLAAPVPFSATLHGGIDVYGLNHAAKLRDAAFACAISLGTRQDIDAVAPGKALADDVPCGVNMDLFALCQRTRAPVLRLISVGRLNHGKGIGDTLQALAQIRGQVGVRYTLVGSGPHEADLRARTEQLGLQDIVTFAGPAAESEVAAHLAAHDVAVLTSTGTFEATATAIREAMATGMPVIMSRIGDAERMVQDGVTGLLVGQHDVAGIARAITWFAEHPDRIETMGRAAHEMAKAAFSDIASARIFHAAISSRMARNPRM